MAREATVTQEQVSAAADSLVVAGHKPTNRAVLEAVGSGSMATIVKLMQVWRARQQRASDQINDTVDPDVERAITAMLARRIAEATSECNARLAELQADLAVVIAESERQTTETEGIRAELEMERAMRQSQAGQIEQLQDDLTQARKTAESETAAREAAQIELAKAELRLEGVPALHDEVRELRIQAKQSGEEAAELRGRLAGMEQGRTGKPG